MAENSNISWTDSTLNPWRGCTKVDAACLNCYAETLSDRNPKVLGRWGPDGTRVVASAVKWKEPIKWDKSAAKAGRRHRVFCASLADVFEDWFGPMLNSQGQRLALYSGNNGILECAPYAEQPPVNCRWVTMGDMRNKLFELIRWTPNLDWLLLTKRPQNIERMICEAGIGAEWPFQNVWLGTTVGDRKGLSRLDVLRKIPAAVRFVSFEPLLEDLGTVDLTGIHWAIVGGESGGGRRRCEIAWFQSLHDQCVAAGVKYFVKQDMGAKPGTQGRIPLSLWTVKEFPTAAI